MEPLNPGHSPHFHRRTLLAAAGAAGLSWLTPLAERLGRAAEQAPRGDRARSVIVLWLQGGPSQLETFDPHPGKPVAGGTAAIKTSVPGLSLAEGLEQVAAEMHSISIVRSLVSKEGDHERATYQMKTGFRPDPTIVHPSLGAIVCHQLPSQTQIPRHVSILPGPWPARGGYLGDQFDAFKIGDPRGRIPDVLPQVDAARAAARIADLDIVEAEFARGRLSQLDPRRKLQRSTTEAALRMMSSEQLRAFDVNEAPESQRREYGDTPFGRGCLAALRLIEAGVRCVEVTLDGWDSHVNNHQVHKERVATLDPAFAALVRDLRRRELLGHTVVLCGGEFGRTPRVNPAGGRDHWPHGFSMALCGGGIVGGRVIGGTSSELPPEQVRPDWDKNVADPRKVSDVHATVLAALGIDFQEMQITPIGRPLPFSEGAVIRELLA